MRTAACVAILFVVALALGVANPVRGASIRTDSLGPYNDETASQYIARVEPLGGSGDRWALVSFTRSLHAEEIARAVDGVRVSVVYTHVPLDRVQTPLVEVPVPDTESVLAASVRRAAASVSPGSGERAAAVAALTRARMEADCACVAAVLVRGGVSELTALTGGDIRVVEALPADAVYGQFAVSPLYPEREGDAVQPDDGPIPPA